MPTSTIPAANTSPGKTAKEEELFRRCEKLSKAAEPEKPVHKPGSCKRCIYHRPDFRYRRCHFSRWPYGQSEGCILPEAFAAKWIFLEAGGDHACLNSDIGHGLGHRFQYRIDAPGPLLYASSARMRLTISMAP